jgi:hypothetical protein
MSSFYLHCDTAMAEAMASHVAILRASEAMAMGDGYATGLWTIWEGGAP